MKKILEQTPSCMNTKNKEGWTPIAHCALYAQYKDEKEKPEREEIIFFY